MVPSGSSRFDSSVGALQGSCGGIAKMASLGVGPTGGSSALGSSTGALPGSGGRAMGGSEDDEEGSLGGDGARDGSGGIGDVAGRDMATGMFGGAS